MYSRRIAALNMSPRRGSLDRLDTPPPSVMHNIAPMSPPDDFDWVLKDDIDISRVVSQNNLDLPLVHSQNNEPTIASVNVPPIPQSMQSSRKRSFQEASSSSFQRNNLKSGCNSAPHNRAYQYDISTGGNLFGSSYDDMITGRRTVEQSSITLPRSLSFEKCFDSSMFDSLLLDTPLASSVDSHEQPSPLFMSNKSDPGVYSDEPLVDSGVLDASSESHCSLSNTGFKFDQLLLGDDSDLRSMNQLDLAVAPCQATANPASSSWGALNALNLDNNLNDIDMNFNLFSEFQTAFQNEKQTLDEHVPPVVCESEKQIVTEECQFPSSSLTKSCSLETFHNLNEVEIASNGQSKLSLHSTNIFDTLNLDGDPKTPSDHGFMSIIDEHQKELHESFKPSDPYQLLQQSPSHSEPPKAKKVAPSVDSNYERFLDSYTKQPYTRLRPKYEFNRSPSLEDLQPFTFQANDDQSNFPFDRPTIHSINSKCITKGTIRSRPDRRMRTSAVNVRHRSSSSPVVVSDDEHFTARSPLHQMNSLDAATSSQPRSFMADKSSEDDKRPINVNINVFNLISMTDGSIVKLTSSSTDSTASSSNDLASILSQGGSNSTVQSVISNILGSANAEPPTITKPQQPNGVASYQITNEHKYTQRRPDNSECKPPVKGLCTKWETTSNEFCSVCQMSFSSSSLYISHCSKVHNDDRPYKCKECAKTFTSRSKLNRHMKDMHENRVFTCPVEGCKKTFTRPSNAKTHLAVTHRLANVFICPKSECQTILFTEEELRSHKAQHQHSYRFFICPNRSCEFRVAERLAMRVHLQHHHRTWLDKMMADIDCLMASLQLHQLVDGKVIPVLV